jgi:hypothetical protein
MKKALLMLGGALLLVAVLFLIQDYRARAALRPKFAFDTASAESVVRLHITYQEASVELVRAGTSKPAQWKTGSDGYPADTVRLRTVLDHLVRLQKRERVSEGGSNAVLAEFGLDSAEAKRVEWKDAEGKTFAVLVGKTSGSDFNSTYWKPLDEAAVYRTPGSITFDISVQQNDWRDRNLFPFFIFEEVKSVTVDWVDSLGHRIHYRLDKESDTMVTLVEPALGKVPTANGRAVLTQTPQFVIDDFTVPEDPNIAAAGLDTPMVSIRTTLQNGSIYTLMAGRAFDGNYYAKHPGLPGAVVKIAAWRLNFFRKTPDQLLLPPPPDSPDDVIEGMDTPPGDPKFAP